LSNRRTTALKLYDSWWKRCQAIIDAQEGLLNTSISFHFVYILASFSSGGYGDEPVSELMSFQITRGSRIFYYTDWLITLIHILVKLTK